MRAPFCYCSLRFTALGVLLAVLFAWLALAPMWAGAAAEADDFRVSRLTIESANGRHAFTVEVAETEDQHARGLMFRRELAPDSGMLFDYARPQPIAMWMKNTYIPLDMFFIGADGRILNIVAHTVPFSLKAIHSLGPALAVLEVNGGTAERLGIRRGDRVLHPIFGTEP